MGDSLSKDYKGKRSSIKCQISGVEVLRSKVRGFQSVFIFLRSDVKYLVKFLYSYNFAKF